jgi:hypothetical protein
MEHKSSRENQTELLPGVGLRACRTSPSVRYGLLAPAKGLLKKQDNLQRVCILSVLREIESGIFFLILDAQTNNGIHNLQEDEGAHETIH